MHWLNSESILRLICPLLINPLHVHFSYSCINGLASLSAPFLTTCTFYQRNRQLYAVHVKLLQQLCQGSPWLASTPLWKHNSYIPDAILFPCLFLLLYLGWRKRDFCFAYCFLCMVKIHKSICIRTNQTLGKKCKFLILFLCEFYFLHCCLISFKGLFFYMSWWETEKISVFRSYICIWPVSWQYYIRQDSFRNT